jgi:hypothetical protein
MTKSLPPLLGFVVLRSLPTCFELTYLKFRFTKILSYKVHRDDQVYMQAS